MIRHFFYGVIATLVFLLAAIYVHPLHPEVEWMSFWLGVGTAVVITIAACLGILSWLFRATGFHR